MVKKTLFKEVGLFDEDLPAFNRIFVKRGPLINDVFKDQCPGGCMIDPVVPAVGVPVHKELLKEQGLEFVSEADESTTGPASFVIEDPDGNPILVDQHV
mgnify:CR=1 FL=1